MRIKLLGFLALVSQICWINASSEGSYVEI